MSPFSTAARKSRAHIHSAEPLALRPCPLILKQFRQPGLLLGAERAISRPGLYPPAMGKDIAHGQKAAEDQRQRPGQIENKVHPLGARLKQDIFAVTGDDL